MRVKFWGVRGSIPTPGPKTIRYGGNTSCIEVTSDEGTPVILDAGTGIRSLGERLAAKSPVELHLLISHTHWDHIHGFPFFIPAYIPNNKIHIYGPSHFDLNMEQIMSKQMEYTFFPVRVDELRAELLYRDLKEETFQLEDFTVTTKLMNHPVTCFGYRLEEKGKSVVYTGDHEPYYNFLDGSDGDEEDREEVEMIVKEQNERIVEFVRGADLLVCDAQYLEEEYPSKIGWGHSSTEKALELAIKGGVEELVLFHHEPTRSDDDMDLLLEKTLERRDQLGRPDLAVRVAKEGEEIFF